MWQGQACVIVGGGPSLRKFPWWLLKSHRTIGINRAGESLQCDVHFGIDRTYWEHTAPSYGVAVWVDDGNRRPESVDVMLPAVGDLWDTKWSESLAVGLGRGGHSGYAALHLAYLLGADPIYLLGFDCRGEDGQTAWWHKGYPGPKSNARVYERFAQSFEVAAKHIGDRRRVVLLNHPDPNVDPSAVTAFEQATWEVLV